MKSTSQKYKDAIYAPTRSAHGRVTFDISDTTAAGDVTSITATSESSLSVKNQMINKVRSSTYKTATLEQDRFLLDGSFSFADDVIANNGELGYSSAVICGVDSKFDQPITANFVGKVTGSTTANPNIMRGSNTTATLVSAGSGGEFSQFDCDAVSTLNGTLSTWSATTNTFVAQQIFSFDLISIVERKYGISIGADTATKVAWLKANITKLTCNWYGFGSSPTGNKATLNRWNVAGVAWGGAQPNHTNSTVTKLTQIDTIGVKDIVDANGFVHYLSNADASNGTVASTIKTDYVELLVEGAGNQTITFNFSSNHSSAGLTITFDSVMGEYATDFDMTAYNSVGGVIATTSVTGNTDVITVPLGQLYNYRSVSVVIKKWSKPNRRARVMEVDFGFVKQYTDDNLISMNLIEEMDMLSSKIPSAEFKFTVDNSARLFNILNPTGFYKYLQQKQQVIAEIGLDIGGGVIEYIPIGNYLLQEWKSDEGSLTATFTTRTNLDSMTSFDYENLTATTKTLYQLAVDMFVLCGITNYSIDTALQSINTNSLVQKTNCRNVLQMIAIAGGANIYVTRGNIITLKCNKTRKVRYIRDWVNGSTANMGNHWVEIQALNSSGTNVALSKTYTSNGTIGNANFLLDGSTNTSNYSLVTPEDGTAKYVNIDLGSIMDIASVNVWHYYADGRTYHNTKTEISQDGVTWKTVFDSAVSGEYAETSAGRTYAMETVIGDMTPNDTATFDNMYQEPQIALDKAIKRVEVTYWSNLSTSAIVGVNDAVNTLGDTLKLEKNTLINDSTRATAVANWFMAQIKYRATYRIKWRGNPALELNDVLSFENTYGGNMSAYVTRYELDYAGYLAARTEAKGVVN